ncbi:MAG: hypothetical protein EOP09_05020, partial [Proteobacteria bacterium]
MRRKPVAKKSLFSKEIQQFKSKLDRAKRVLISTHLLPDGDGLGAESALYHYLKACGKQVKVVNPDTVPPRYHFIDANKG